MLFAGVVLFVFLSGLTKLSAGASKAGVVVNELTVEYRTNPLGIDTVIPRFSWQIRSEIRAQKQTAYHVLVASSPEELAKDQGDLWDSGKVPGGIQSRSMFPFSCQDRFGFRRI